jgi:hypothetical protein
MTTPAQAVMTGVRERVRRFISTPVMDGDALSMCLACATVESEALLEFSHDRIVRSEAVANCKKLALSADEFDALLCDASLAGTRRTTLAAALAAEETDDECKRRQADIAAALKLTLTEKAQQKRWRESARTRTRVALAMLRKEGHVQCLEAALGSVLRADHRLIEDLRARTEEEGIDLITVSSLIGAVSRTLTA